MGATNMIIKRLEIKHLYGMYNYNVKFNDDLTFIYGENGCGKTTILDIVSSIVTGRLYKLFIYKFDEIILTYRETKGKYLRKFKIKAQNEAYELSLNMTNNLPPKQEIIKDIRRLGEMYSREDDDYSFEPRFMNMFEFPRFLKDTFNYIYLPLSRNSQDGINIVDNVYFKRRMRYSEKDIVNKNYLNDSLRYVEEIIRSSCMKISSSENLINSKFRSNILTSSLKVRNEYSLRRLLNSDNNTLSNIDQSQKEYIKTLRSIGEWNDDTNRRVETFFDKYRAAFIRAQQEDGKGHPGYITVDFLLMNMEFNRIKEIASQAQEIEREKKEIRAPITAFLETVNSFFEMGEDKKQISISDEGKIVVETDSFHRELSLYNLSSGEKQIVIIFACLIFGLPVGQSGIYIIDEPEASLHLAWQRNFVESIQKVNGDIQLIFATHAPEIIGHYSDHTVKLKKTIIPLIER